MFRPIALLAVGLTSVAVAQAPQVQISIGVRETGFAGGDIFAGLGGTGGSSVAGIEWIDLDGQTLTLDGTWQQFAFHLDPLDPNVDPVTPFAGASANGILEGTFGTIEHIRVRNIQGLLTPIELWVDDFADTYTPVGGSQTTTIFETFEGYASNVEVMFQESTFSGSTDTNIVNLISPLSDSRSDNYIASRPFGAQHLGPFQFVDNSPNRWVRFTTYNVANRGNPQVYFDQGSVITFWLRGGKSQVSLGSQGPGTAVSEMVGTGLFTGQQSTYYIAGVPPGNPGVLAVSLNGFPDIPFLGGNLVSFGGYVLSLNLSSNPITGMASIGPLPGNAVFGDLVFQSAYLDVSQPNLFTFTNALNVKTGI